MTFLQMRAKKMQEHLKSLPFLCQRSAHAINASLEIFAENVVFTLLRTFRVYCELNESHEVSCDRLVFSAPACCQGQQDNKLISIPVSSETTSLRILSDSTLRVMTSRGAPVYMLHRIRGIRWLTFDSRIQTFKSSGAGGRPL